MTDWTELRECPGCPGCPAPHTAGRQRKQRVTVVLPVVSTDAQHDQRMTISVTDTFTSCY